MKALPLLVKKLWPRLKFFKSRSNFKVKVTRSKILVPVERSCHIRNVQSNLSYVTLQGKKGFGSHMTGGL